MIFNDNIRIVSYKDKVALFDISGTKNYVLLTKDKFTIICNHLAASSSLPDHGILSKMAEMGWFLPVSDTGETEGTVPHVTIELTERCNASCVHCYYSAKNTQSEVAEISAHDFSRFVRPFISKLGSIHVGLTGGEPTISKDIISIVSDLLDMPIKTLMLYSNGLSLPIELIELAQREKERIGIQISLDGATEKTNDALRGKGTFNKVMSTLQLLQESRCVRVWVKMTITPNNYSEYSLFHDLVKSYGFQPSISTYKRIGRGRDLFSYDEVQQVLIEIQRKHLSPLFNISPCDNPHLVFCNLACGLGRKKSCVISPTLDLLDCVSMRHSLGNLKTNPDLALKSYAELYFPSVEEIPSCRECEVRYACIGGCRSIAYSLNGDILDRQPYCSLYRELYRMMIWREDMTEAASHE